MKLGVAGYNLLWKETQTNPIVLLLRVVSEASAGKLCSVEAYIHNKNNRGGKKRAMGEGVVVVGAWVAEEG